MIRFVPSERSKAEIHAVVKSDGVEKLLFKGCVIDKKLKMFSTEPPPADAVELRAYNQALSEFLETADTLIVREKTTLSKYLSDNSERLKSVLKHQEPLVGSLKEDGWRLLKNALMIDLGLKFCSPSKPHSMPSNDIELVQALFSAAES